MRQGEFLAKVVAALEAVGIRYFVTGSTASTFYGEPRFTADVDIVVELAPNQVAPFLAQFPASEFYVSPEAAHHAIMHGRTFNIIHSASGNKADIVVPKQEAFVYAQMARAKEVVIEGGPRMRLASPEDVILSKLRFYQEGGSEKHLRDIAGILRTASEPLDIAYIERWVEPWGLGELWRKLLECKG